MEHFNVEIASGLGPTVGQVRRIGGLIGGVRRSNAQPAAVELVLAAFEKVLAAQGWKDSSAVVSGAGLFV